MKHFTSDTQKIGLLGETFVAQQLVTDGFIIIEKNYTKKIGEIDIIAKKNGILHFIEVKTIIQRQSLYNPFENISYLKLKKMTRTILWYLIEKRVSRETRWQIDAIAVIIDKDKNKTSLNYLWNIT